MKATFLRWALLPAFASAGLSQTYTNGHWTYELNASNEATILLYDGPGGAVEIPSSLDSYPVTKLAADGSPWIGSWYSGSTDVTSVSIPDGITSIGSYAFMQTTSLTNVSIPNSVTNIGDAAFRECTSLTSITIPYGATSIGRLAFDGCTNLTNVAIGTWVQQDVSGYNPYSFIYIFPSTVSHVTIADGVTSIGYGKFQSCTNLISVTIPDSVRSIRDEAFSGCAALASVTIPNGVTSIGNYAFRECTALASVTIPDSVITIGHEAFYGCASLATLTITPNYNLSLVNSRAFGNCTSLSGTITLSILTVFLPDSFPPGVVVRREMASLAAALANEIVAALPDNHGIATKSDLGTAVSNAVSQTVSRVQANPNSYNLYSSEQYAANYNNGVTAGTSLVTANPTSYNLYTSNSIMDLRMNGLMVQKQGGDAVVTFQPQTTTDLGTQPFTNNGTPITNTIPMPANKGFLRIQAR